MKGIKTAGRWSEGQCNSGTVEKGSGTVIKKGRPVGRWTRRVEEQWDGGGEG